MRIRTVKPEFWSHPIMGRLDDATQLLALALLNHADDHGYFHADVAIVRGACAPFRDDLATISRSLAKLSEVGWIVLGESPEHGQIGYIKNWSKHQKVDHPKPSKIQGYFPRENFAKLREEIALEQGTGNREQGTGSEGSSRSPWDDLREAIKASGGAMVKSGEDLWPEWVAAVKGHDKDWVLMQIPKVRPEWPGELRKALKASQGQEDYWYDINKRKTGT